MSAISEYRKDGRAVSRLDKLGIIVAAIALVALFLQPFALFRANRIVAAENIMVWSAMPLWQAVALVAAMLAAIAVILFKTPVNLRLGVSVAAIAVLALMVGRAGYFLMPEDNPYARVSPGASFCGPYSRSGARHRPAARR